MREIKFRVWDEIPKKMWYPEEGLKACVTQIGSVCTDETDDGGILENRSYRLTAMFYTGLEDKNGKEIYEGDIVNFDNSDIGGSKVTGEVMFNIDSTLSNLEWGLWTKRGYHRTDFLGHLEIIGNIYENPDLLALEP